MSSLAQGCSVVASDVTNGITGGRATTPNVRNFFLLSPDIDRF